MRMRARLAALALAGVAIAVPAGLAQEPEAVPRFESDVDVVAVDVSVVDDRGRPQRDLKLDEFQVKVDGQRRKVLSATFVDLAGTPAPAAPASAGAPSRAAAPARSGARQVVIVVDRGQLGGGGVRRATEAAARLLDHLSGGDRVAVYSLPSGPRVDFTSDRAAVDKALARIGPAQDRFTGEFNVSLAEAISFVERGARFDNVAQRECERLAKSERVRVLEFCVQRVEAEARQQVDLHRRSVEDRLNALEAVFGAIAGVPGTKTVVLVSGGLTSPAYGSQSSLVHHLRRVAARAAEARASLYTLNLADLGEGFAASRARASNTMSEDTQVRGQGLEFLTGMAGGATFDVVAGANWAFERVASEISGHYLLSLEPAKHDRDGKPHDIEVKVARHGVQVRARRQFVLDPRTRVARSSTPSVPSATASPVRITPHVMRGPVDSQIKVVLAAEVEGFSEGRLAVQVVNPAGAVVGTLADVLRKGDGPHARWEDTLLLTRGPYVLRADATDAAGRRVTAESPLNAELQHGVGFDASDLMLFERTGTSLRLLAGGTVRSGVMAAYLELYLQPELPTDRLGVKIDVVAADGTRRGSSVLALRPGEQPGLLFAEGQVDLWGLPPGPYVARALVTFGPKVARRIDRAFEVKR